MTEITLDAIRNCLDGQIPGALTTVSRDGTPNIARISQVDYVDQRHVALSFQFFSKTRENVLANPHVQIDVVDPATIAHYSLEARYLRTETAGPRFEGMKAKLAGIASHAGMSKVFRLLGADIYEVLAIRAVPGMQRLDSPPMADLLPLLRASTRQLALCVDLAGLIEELLNGLENRFGLRHVMLLMHDGPGERLYTVASRGYAHSGVGSEIPIGTGVIGVAAREQCPIRINHWTAEYAYSLAVRKSFQDTEAGKDLETEIPLPGLSMPNSQMAVPFVQGNTLLGVLYVESPEEARFSYQMEDALVVLMQQFAVVMAMLQQSTAESISSMSASTPPDGTAGPPLRVRRYPVNDSVFIDDDYLIKGVAGAICWKLLKDYQELGRTEFTNRELRLDASLRLPDISDNLEARLILLQRRLAERCDGLAIEKTGRGRFRLCVAHPMELLECSPGAG